MVMRSIVKSSIRRQKRDQEEFVREGASSRLVTLGTAYFYVSGWGLREIGWINEFQEL